MQTGDRFDSPVARRPDSRIVVIRQYGSTERAVTSSEYNFAEARKQSIDELQLELYGMQKSHPSDEPRRESAKAVILHMGDVGVPHRDCNDLLTVF